MEKCWSSYLFTNRATVTSNAILPWNVKRRSVLSCRWATPHELSAEKSPISTALLKPTPNYCSSFSCLTNVWCIFLCQLLCSELGTIVIEIVISFQMNSRFGNAGLGWRVTVVDLGQGTIDKKNLDIRSKRGEKMMRTTPATRKAKLTSVVCNM